MTAKKGISKGNIMDSNAIDDIQFSLSQADIQAFERNGHLSIPVITSVGELDWMRTAYDRLFDQRRGWEEGDLTDFAGQDAADKKPSVPQLLNPSRYEPGLATTQYRRNALKVAKQLLGPNAELVFEHAMLKPPMTGGVTPWHQDQSFYERYTNYEAITFWMPLQDVDFGNGCMSFIDGSQKGPLLHHQSIGNDPRVHGLEVVDTSQIGVDPKPTPCFLRCGEVSIHHSLTLHSAGGNASAVPRRAYALGFGVRSRAYTLRREHPWNVSKVSDRMRRADEGSSVGDRLRTKFKTIVKAVVR